MAFDLCQFNSKGCFSNYGTQDGSPAPVLAEGKDRSPAPALAEGEDRSPAPGNKQVWT